ncbi:MAG: RNA-binding protein [Hyphomicrobiales bacterium]|nr:RNA-binding protein [Hyphomicrobiales bacterium]
MTSSDDDDHDHHEVQGTGQGETALPPGAERTCVVTRRVLAKGELLRFVMAPDGAVVPDIRCRLPGRGAWVSADHGSLARAVSKGLLARALRIRNPAAGQTAPAVRADMVEFVDGLLEQDCLQALALANKAGVVLCGHVKIEQSLRREAPLTLLHATDAGSDGVRKLNQLWRGLWPAADGEAFPEGVNIFASAQLDLVLGRTNVIHAALKTAMAAESVKSRAVRLVKYRS